MKLQTQIILVLINITILAYLVAKDVNRLEHRIQRLEQIQVKP